MQKGIERIKMTRVYLLNLIEGLTTVQLNEVPVGYNNNIIWNLGHLIASQQSICYLRSGLKIFIDEEYLASYKPGTTPNKLVTSAEVIRMKKLYITAIDQFGKDHEEGFFSNHPHWKTNYGIEVANIEEAISFVLFHEGLHVGYMMALRRLLISEIPATNSQ
ncbi:MULTISPECIES: DinB family protein [unclassified Mucilaginibacter]|uniref:DinB family protein n=1 Tax=unclassified Mucilaginibacter TaxID=2617802 RepID=UPI002AC92CE7|nr:MULTISPECIES: DinB family protein [unclassified Mucilaginibacter]MEB0260306.1 DinB family protein [Mucilaginibacter sp. 10I4]MEB0277283.1 DinB family protein [Mucilaginibacter sp. 10B2]MEB0303198.1 DinB family protein [Mucilaginibacter sp. 5C4]WPX25409.1 DinB family protein [Mucilaginibacter sp. 5C4]